MPIQLDEAELRVLGVLIEKSLAQPNQYPMTLNAIISAANQRQNRDPVVDYTEAEIGKTLYRLEQRGLVKHATPAPGARANRFAHHVVDVFHWDRRAQAVMAELMLRGRQTAGELRSRAARMTPLQDLESVTNILGELKAADPPFVEELPREPGKSAVRFRHLLSADSSRSPAQTDQARHDDEASAISDPAGSLAERIVALEARVAELERIVTDLSTNPSPGVE